MRKWRAFVSGGMLLLGLLVVGCSDPTSSTNEGGFAIYRTQLGPSVEQLTRGELELEQLALVSMPITTLEDIGSYDWDDQEVECTSDLRFDPRIREVLEAVGSRGDLVP